MEYLWKGYKVISKNNVVWAESEEKWGQKLPVIYPQLPYSDDNLTVFVFQCCRILRDQKADPYGNFCWKTKHDPAAFLTPMRFDNNSNHRTTKNAAEENCLR